MDEKNLGFSIANMDQSVSPAAERLLVAWAQLWMSKERPELLQVLVRSDRHTPSAFRAAGPLVNLDEFFATFRIKPGDPMWRNRKDRVEIW
jgi:putative endopeptidase